MDSTYILLQHYWWFLVSLLGALLVFLLFVQGGQSLLFTIGKTELQQKMLLNSTGRKCYSIRPVSAEPTGCGC